MNLEDHMERLAAMSPVKMKAEWRRVFNTPVPPAFGAALATRAIAARYQEQVFAGLTKSEQRQLKTQARKDQRNPRGVRAAAIKPGTWLSRTWHGNTHEVVVLDTGFEYRGEHYRSLTAIAKHITGAAWSGPRFFGLHSNRLGKLKVSRHA